MEKKVHTHSYNHDHHFLDWSQNKLFRKRELSESGKKWCVSIRATGAALRAACGAWCGRNA